jgi:hypothetical protein
MDLLNRPTLRSEVTPLDRGNQVAAGFSPSSPIRRDGRGAFRQLHFRHDDLAQRSQEGCAWFLARQPPDQDAGRPDRDRSDLPHAGKSPIEVAFGCIQWPRTIAAQKVPDDFRSHRDEWKIQELALIHST